jgi:FkbM family methyltransferase
MTDPGAARMAAQGEALRAMGFWQKRPGHRLAALLEQSFLALLALLAPAATIEIGAHEARFSREVRRRLPATPRILAFEANPAIAARHAAGLAALGIEYRAEAIADRAGELRFRIPGTAGRGIEVMGTLRPARLGQGLSIVEDFAVPAVTLDSLGLDGAAIWADVEGALGEVIAGGGATLSTAVAVYAELDEEPQWPGGLVAGEAIAALGRHGLVPLLRDSQHPLAYNCIFLRREVLLGQQGPGGAALLRWQNDHWRAVRRLGLLMPWWDARIAFDQAYRRWRRG